MSNATQLQIQSFADPMFSENSLVVSAGGPDCWIIDPGFAPQPQQVLEYIKSQSLSPQAIVLTHCHVDHIVGIPIIREAFPEIEIHCPIDEVQMLTDPAANLSANYGVPISVESADREIRPGDTLELGGLTFDVRDVAGHSPGGLAFYQAESGVVIVGDALFNGSVGRVDFPGSSGPRLLKNIREQLLTLPDETRVYCGHGPETTIGHERQHNPFLQPGMNLE